MKIQKILQLIPTKENHLSKLDKSIPNFSGIYFIYNLKLELIYIGKTKHLRNRILQHIGEKTIRKGDGSRYAELGFIVSKIPFGESKYYSYIKIDNEEEKVLRELILINILKPKYNYKFNIQQNNTFPLPKGRGIQEIN